MPENHEKKSYEELLNASKKMKKKILLVLGGIVALLLVLFLLVEGIGLLTTLLQEEPEGEYYFYPTYEGNIMENPEYLDLDRSVVYAENASGYGVSTSITEENREEFDEYVLFLYDYLQTIIAGDEEAYNACFTYDYLNEYGEQKSFSPQMLYDMRIALYGKEGSDADLRVTYQLDYCFYQNDGTFRRDVGSGASRPVYVVLVKDAAGNLRIDLLVVRYET